MAENNGEEIVITQEAMDAKRESHAHFMYLPEDRLRYCILRDRGLIKDENEAEKQPSTDAAEPQTQAESENVPALQSAASANSKLKISGNTIAFMLVIVFIAACVYGAAFGIKEHFKMQELENNLADDELVVGCYYDTNLLCAPHPEAHEVVLIGSDNTHQEQKVFIASRDNINLVLRSDGKDFTSIKLSGNIKRIAPHYITADKATILARAEKDSQYYFLKNTLKNLQSGAYEAK